MKFLNVVDEFTRLCLTIKLIEAVGDGQFFWHVDTPPGEACLKRFRAIGEVESSTLASLYLHERGVTHTPRVIPAADGRPYVRSPMTDPVWYLVLLEWVPGVGSDEKASTLWKWLGRTEKGSPQYRGAAEQKGRFLGRFHEASQGFRAWPVDRDATFWVWNFQRVRHQVALAHSRVRTEERPKIKELVETALAGCEPVLDEVIHRAERHFDLFETVLNGCRERADVRYCDLHLGNFLIGEEGLMIIDLAELEPGPRITEVHGLWRFDETSNELAARAYCEETQLTLAEVDLFPIINDRIGGF